MNNDLKKAHVQYHEMVKELIEIAKDEIAHEWPEGEFATMFEDLLSQFRDLLIFVSSEYRCCDPNDPHEIDLNAVDMFCGDEIDVDFN